VNQHITPDLATLTDSASYLRNDHVHVGDGKGLSISLDIPCYVPLNATLHYIVFFMFLILPNHCYLFKYFIVIIMFILNFTPLCFI